MKNSKFTRLAMMIAVATGLTAASTASAAGGKYTARNSMRIVGDASDPGRFDILQRAGNGGADYWCAAGEYVIRGRGLDPATRIFLVQPLGKGRLGRNSIGFTITPDTSLVSSGNGATMSMKRVGQNWSAAHAYGQCEIQSRKRR